MTRADLVVFIQQRGVFTKKQAEEAVDSVLHGIQTGLRANGKVAVVGFGTLAVKVRAPRTGRNPKTGAAIQIAGHKTVTFKPGKDLLEAVQ